MRKKCTNGKCPYIVWGYDDDRNNDDFFGYGNLNEDRILKPKSCGKEDMTEEGDTCSLEFETYSVNSFDPYSRFAVDPEFHMHRQRLIAMAIISKSDNMVLMYRILEKLYRKL